MTRLFSVFIYCMCVFVAVSSYDPSTCIRCRESHVCNPPECFCCRDKMPLDAQKIPQMVFFTFDDAVQPQVAAYYRELFDSARLNPNGCPIKMTLFISHQNTVYSLVREFYEKGMEIASHSVNHGHPNPRTFMKEAKQQRENLSKRARIPLDEIKGWRSPFLEPLGDIQPDVLKQLGYEYDATLTIAKHGANDKAILPFTLDYGWPYGCKIKPCPTKGHKGFWQIPVVTVKDYKKKYDCVYVDGCNIPPPTEELAYKFLWDNFQTYYKTNRAPMGINMHASWFYYPYRKAAMNRFIEHLSKMDDVYIVTIKQVIEWLRNPTPLSQLKDFKPWRCDKNISTAVTEATSAFDVRQKKIQLDLQQRRQRQRQRTAEQRHNWQPVALQTQRRNTDFTRRPPQQVQSPQQDNQIWQMQQLMREQAPNPPLALNFPFRFWWRQPPALGQFPRQDPMRMGPMGIPFAQQEMQRRMVLRRRQDIIREQRRLNILEEQRTREEQARQEQQRQAELQQHELKRLEELQRQKEVEIQKQEELQRQIVAEQKAQQGLKLQQELERQRLQEIKLHEELKRQAEIERQLEIKRQQDLVKQKEQKRLAELKRQAELEKQMLAEIKRQEDMKRKAELERQIEIQRRAEIKRQEDMKRQAELEHKKELQRLAEIKRQEDIKRQADLERKKELQRLTEIKRQEDIKRQAEEERQKEIQRQIEIRKQEELEQKRLAEIKRQEKLKRKAEMQRQQEMQRQRDIARHKEMEQKMHADLRHQAEINILKEMERQLMAETDHQRIAELQRQAEVSQQAELQRQLEKERKLQLLNDQQLATQNHQSQIKTIGPLLLRTQSDNQNKPTTISSAEIMVNNMDLQNELQRQTDIRKHLDQQKVLAKLERQKQLEANKEALRQQEVTRLEEMKTRLHTKVTNSIPATDTAVPNSKAVVSKVKTNHAVKANTRAVENTNTGTSTSRSSSRKKIGSKAMWQVDISDLIDVQSPNQFWTSLFPVEAHTSDAKPTHSIAVTKAPANNLFSINSMDRMNPYIVPELYTTKVTKQTKPPTPMLSFFETTNILSREPVPVSFQSFMNAKAQPASPSHTSYNPTTLPASTLRTPIKPTSGYTTQQETKTSGYFTQQETKASEYNRQQETKTSEYSTHQGTKTSAYATHKETKPQRHADSINSNEPHIKSNEGQEKTTSHRMHSSETSTEPTTAEIKSTTQPTVLKRTQTITKTSTTPSNTKKVDLKSTYNGIQYFTSNPTVHDRRRSAFTGMINLPPPSQIFPSPLLTSSQPRWSTFSTSYFNISSTKQPAYTCKQGTNCMRPDCVCKSTTFPESLTAGETPQIIYITVDGSINFHTYSKLRTVFNPSRMNPNGCRIKGTAFANDEGSSYRIGDVLRQNGMEVALMGMDTKPYTSVDAINTDINEQKSKIVSSSTIPIQTLNGWRSPQFKVLGDEQFSLLGHRGMYDSSLLVYQSGEDEPKLWPFTLDFGWHERCEMGTCPIKNHPGVWEVPVIPLRGPNDTRTCEYTDGCTSQPSSEQDTFNYLMDNFNSYYKTNKAPFSIRLKQIWFHWHYRKNFAGLMRFLDKVLSFGDVYVTSVSDLIEWMKAPTPLSELHTFKPWQC